MESTKRHAGDITGVSNLTYDLLSLLQNKLEAITALEMYKQDASGDQEIHSFFSEIQQRDKQDVERLKTYLGKHLK